MAFLLPAVGGIVGGLLGKFAIKEGLKLGGRLLARTAGNSALGGAFSGLLTRSAPTLGNIAGAGLSAVGGVIGSDIASAMKNKEKATPENIMIEKYMAHIKDLQQQNEGLQNVVFGMHNEDFRRFNNIRAVSKELQEIDKRRNLRPYGRDIS